MMCLKTGGHLPIIIFGLTASGAKRRNTVSKVRKFSGIVAVAFGYGGVFI